MIPNSCKRFAEMDFPIAVVSAHSAREKSIWHGHPSTLHLWWARPPCGRPQMLEEPARAVILNAVKDLVRSSARSSR